MDYHSAASPRGCCSRDCDTGGGGTAVATTTTTTATRPKRRDLCGLEYFPYGLLPMLVHWKILRQYVPTLTKASVLSKMPEFDDLLNFEESWLDDRSGDHPFADVLRLLGRLEAGGVYFCKRHWWEFFRVVSLEPDSVAFTKYSNMTVVVDRRYPYYGGYPDGPPTPPYVSLSYHSLSEFGKYLRKFLEKYAKWDGKNVNLYHLYKFDWFCVNASEKLVHWSRLPSVHPIKRNRCYIKRGPGMFVEILFENDGTILVDKNFGYGYRHRRSLGRRRLRPLPLDACVSKKTKSWSKREFSFDREDDGSLRVRNVQTY